MSERTPSDPGDEQRLRVAFDATAEEAGGALLTRLRARAADVPAHVRRRPSFVPRWAWAPGFASLGVAAAALAVTFSFEWNDPTAPRASEAVGARLTSPLPPSPAELLAPAPATALEAGSLEEPAEYHPDSDWIEADPADDRGLDPLDGLVADADLDAWLFATARLAQEGG